MISEIKIMVVDSWWWDNGEHCEIPSTINLFNADYSLELIEDYTITPLDYWTDPVSGKNSRPNGG